MNLLTQKCKGSVLSAPCCRLSQPWAVWKSLKTSLLVRSGLSTSIIRL